MRSNPRSNDRGFFFYGACSVFVQMTRDPRNPLRNSEDSCFSDFLFSVAGQSVFDMFRPMNTSRRAYRPDGSMIPPLTVAQHLAGGFRLVEISCSACHHSASIDVTTLPPDMPVPDISLRARCTSCGSRNCTSRPDVVEFYRVIRQVRSSP